MHRHSHSSERGQAIVLIVVAMVVLLGFTAVAVDGSMIYADRRQSQNGSDASSLAGGTRIASSLESTGVSYSTWTASPPNCSGHVLNAVNSAKTAARTRAQDNGFPTSEVTLTGRCDQRNISAPVNSGGTATIFVDKYVDFISQISHPTQTAFAHFVYGGPIVNEVTAITRIRPTQPLAYGYAIVALNPSTGNCNSGSTNGLIMHGLGGNKNGLVVSGAGIWSNGCMKVEGNADITLQPGVGQTQGPSAFYFGTSNNYTLDKINFVGGGNAQKITDNTYKIPPSLYDIKPPDCSGRQFSTAALLNMYKALNPTGTLPANKKPLPSNLYCVTNQLKLNGGDELWFEGSTLVLSDGADIAGNADFRIQAVLWGVNPGSKAVPGLAIYQPPTVTSRITINGNSFLRLRGSILAPGAYIKIEGDATTTAPMMVQIIGFDVTIGGSSDTEVKWNEDKQIHRPATLELQQ